MTSAPYAELAVVTRSGVVESRHFGSLVALAPDGSVRVALGSADAVLPRSSMKPVQAVAALLAGAPLEGEALAIAAGSHTGEDVHVDVVKRMLTGAGLDEGSLRCPPDWPEDEATRERLIRAGASRSRIRMNCSGKHAGLLAACVAQGWSTDDYLDPGHPLQRLVRETWERLTGETTEHVAIDGCGTPLFTGTLLGLARLYRALVTAPEGTPERRVADAMREHPRFVGGTGQQNTEAMRAVPGLLAKGGAEGVIAMATDDGAAVAMKVVDGSPRATTLIGLTVLGALGADVGGAGALTDLPVLGGGVPVGAIAVGSDVDEALR